MALVIFRIWNQPHPLVPTKSWWNFDDLVLPPHFRKPPYGVWFRRGMVYGYGILHLRINWKWRCPTWYVTIIFTIMVYTYIPCEYINVKYTLNIPQCDPFTMSNNPQTKHCWYGLDLLIFFHSRVPKFGCIKYEDVTGMGYDGIMKYRSIWID
jgi:hypothetical protein